MKSANFLRKFITFFTVLTISAGAAVLMQSMIAFADDNPASPAAGIVSGSLAGRPVANAAISDNAAKDGALQPAASSAVYLPVPQIDSPLNCHWDPGTPGQAVFTTAVITILPGSDVIYEVYLLLNNVPISDVPISRFYSDDTYTSPYAQCFIPLAHDLEFYTGAYSFEVVATDNATGMIAAAGISDVYYYVRPDAQLPAPQGLRWVAGETLTAAWDPVPGASEYQLNLYRDGNWYTYYDGGQTSVDFVKNLLKLPAGNYTFSVRALSPNIEQITNSDYTVSAAKNISPIIEDVKTALLSLQGASADAIAAGLANINSEDLLLAVKSGDAAVLNQLSQLETSYKQQKGIDVSVSVGNGINLDPGAVSVLGAAFSADQPKVTLEFSKLSNPIPYSFANYKNALVMDISLSGVADQENLNAPVRITMPIPAGFDATRIHILHFDSNGVLIEDIWPLIEGDMMIFTLQSFSPFAFVEDYADDEVPAKVMIPSADPPAGDVSPGTEVTLTCPTDGAVIYYTTDGTDPTEASAQYSAPIAITGNSVTIKAIAVKSDMLNSDIAEFTYYVSGAVKPVINITAQPQDKQVTEGSVSGNLTIAADVIPGGTPGYEWFQQISGSDMDKPVGVGSSFAIPATLTAGTYYYYCIVSADGAVDAVSRTATVTVTAAGPPVITINTQPAPLTTLLQGSIDKSLSVSASVTMGAALSYQWYSNSSDSNNGGDPVPGATGAVFAIPADLSAEGSPYYFYCVVSATSGASAVHSNIAVCVVSASTIETLISDLRDGINKGYAQGMFSNNGSYQSVSSFIANAEKQLANGNISNAVKQLQNIVDSLQKDSGKKVNAAYARETIDKVQMIIDDLT